MSNSFNRSLEKLILSTEMLMAVELRCHGQPFDQKTRTGRVLNQVDKPEPETRVISFFFTTTILGIQVEQFNALEPIRERKSVRKLRSTPLSKETIETLIDAARLAPSAMNRQPFEFAAVTDQEMHGKIADATDYGRFIAEAPLCIAVFCKNARMGAPGLRTA